MRTVEVCDAVLVLEADNRLFLEVIKYLWQADQEESKYSVMLQFTSNNSKTSVWFPLIFTLPDVLVHVNVIH